MNILDSFVKNEVELNKDYYYHAFSFDNMLSICKTGIKCAFLQNKKSFGGYNGPYYISLCKKSDFNNSAYQTFIKMGYDMFIIDSKIKAFKATNKSYLGDVFTNTIIPIRNSCYSDEYQVFYKIKKEDIKGLRVSDNYCDLITLKKLVEYMIERKIYIPLFDYTYESDGVIREISKEKILKI